jgi:hypothetical protein
MLRSFRVANHKSIRAEQELLLIPTYEKSPPVVPVAAIYGRNAAGKSNLLDAMRFMQTAVRSSFGRWEAGAGIPRAPYRLDAAALGEPSLFAVNLIIGDMQYVYGFELDDTQIISEWLHAYRQTRRKTMLFEREERNVVLGDSLPERSSRTKALTAALRSNALLLSTAMQLGEQDEFAPVYRWFSTSLSIPRHDPQRIRALLPRRIEDAIESPGFIDLVQSADMDITDIKIDETEEPRRRSDLAEAERLRARLKELNSELNATEDEEHRAELRAMIRRLENMRSHLETPRLRRELTFLQGETAVPMSLEDQSSGTVAYIDLVAHALRVLARGGVLAVDEIDMSLHPRLIGRLIELFRDGNANPNVAQLIFNTHDATLLGTSFGEEVLKRDEIWFVEKRDGATVLYPLTDFRPRQGENREKRYLGGSYGAVPAVFSDSLVERLIDSRKEPVDGTP